MTWRVVARQDAAVTIETRSVKALLGLLVAAVALAGYVYPVFGSDPVTTARFSGFVQGTLTTLVPFVGVLIGYNAVVTERESGAIRLSLSLPQSRWDVVVGKYVSRTGLVVAALLVAMALAGGLVVYPSGELELGAFVLYLGLTVAFGAVWTGLGIAVSLAVSTSRRALVSGVGILFLFVIVWDPLADALAAGLDAVGLVEGELPDVLQLLFAVEPGRVYGRVTAGFVDPGRTIGEAWYLNEWLALVFLVLWVVGPPGVAYARFAGSDLS